jgi:hypothetical protein
MLSKRNVSNKLRLAILLLLSAGIILSFAPGALAQVQTWSGELKFQIKATELSAETGKFENKNKSLTGTLELYTGAEGPPILNDGYYMKFIGTDQNDQFVAMGITQLAMIETELNPSNVKFLAVGVGEFFDPNAPGNQYGIVYVDFNGSYKAAAGEKPEIISLVIKMGGGINGDVIISANPKVKLYKQQP